jgi:alpha-tubulin suppressor-like RCC1 family protein
MNSSKRDRPDESILSPLEIPPPKRRRTDASVSASLAQPLIASSNENLNSTGAEVSDSPLETVCFASAAATASDSPQESPGKRRVLRSLWWKKFQSILQRAHRPCKKELAQDMSSHCWREAIIGVDKLLGQFKDTEKFVYCEVATFGDNDMNQLGRGEGNGDEEPALIPACRVLPKHIQCIVPRQVDAGALTLAIVSGDGCLYTAGVSDKGGTGRVVKGEDDDKNILESQPTKVSEYFSSMPGVDCRDNCVMQVAAGASHMLVLTHEHNVFMFGGYSYDGHYFSDIRARNSERAPTHTQEDNEKQFNDSPFGFNQHPVHVFQLPQKVKAIAAGDSFSAAILHDESLATWGESRVVVVLISFPRRFSLTCSFFVSPMNPSIGIGFHGQLGRSTTMTMQEMDANGDYGLQNLVTDQDKLRDQFLMPLPPVWADGPLTRRRFVKAVACGAQHLLVLAQNEGESQTKVYSCGLNEGGQLGHGDYSPNRHVLTLVRLPLGVDRRLQ